MTATIAPMKLGDIFDRLFKLIGKTWLRSLIICSIILLPATLLLTAGLDTFFVNLTDILEEQDFGSEFRPEQFVDILGTIVWLVLSAFLFTLGTYAATLAVTIVGCAEMSGEPMTWNDALSKGVGIRFLRLIGLLILQVLVFCVLIMIPYALIFAGIAAESLALGFLGGLLLFAGFLAVIFLAISWAFTVPVLGWEESGVMDAFKRSWSLVRGNWWRVFGILILMGLIVSFASSIVLTPLYFVFLWDFFIKYFELLTNLGMGERPEVSMFTDLFQNFGVGIGILSGVSTIVQLLVAPLYTVVLYFDLRARKGEFAQPATPAPATA